MIEMLCSVAIVWANLAYLMVTFPLLLARLQPPSRSAPREPERDGEVLHDRQAKRRALPGPHFSLGQLGLLVNVIAVAWGLFVVINIGWPRPEIYGDDHWGRFMAPLATLALIVSGATYFFLVQRKKTGIVADHKAEPISDPGDRFLAGISVAGYEWEVAG